MAAGSIMLDEAEGDASMDGAAEVSSAAPPAVEPPEHAVRAKAEPRTRARPATTGFFLVSMTFLRNRSDRGCDPSGTPRCEGRSAVLRRTQGLRDAPAFGLRNVAKSALNRHPDVGKAQIRGAEIFLRMFLCGYGPA